MSCIKYVKRNRKHCWRSPSSTSFIYVAIFHCRLYKVFVSSGWSNVQTTFPHLISCKSSWNTDRRVDVARVSTARLQPAFRKFNGCYEQLCRLISIWPLLAHWFDRGLLRSPEMKLVFMASLTGRQGLKHSSHLRSISTQSYRSYLTYTSVNVSKSAHLFHS
jgi:hypothetical protein